MNFNKSEFATLLLQAKGERSINGFGQDVDISPAHISRLCRGKIDTPPSPETIRKLSQGARNGVTYNDLMLSAGHISKQYDLRDTNSKPGKLDMEKRKEFIQIIVSELFQRDYDWSIENSRGNHYTPDITIRLKNLEYTTWFIEFKTVISFHISDIYQLYGTIATMELRSDTKFSIAVDSITAYDQMLFTPPKAIRANLFAMLVDFEGRRIVKEEKLCQY